MGSTGDAPIPIVWKHDDPAAYEEARVGRVFNHRRPFRYPLAVVQATCEQDVVEAVKLAAQKNARVSVRSGGHSWAVWSVRDNAILIDLGKYKHLHLHKSTGILEASTSTTGRVMNEYLSKYGYMFEGGHCPDVGIGGFLLQGGMGWNCKNWGWACEKVRAVDVVTASGELVHCNAEQNSELYWMARGSGPGFPGVVTKFYLEVRKSFSHMMISFFAYPMSEYRQVMDWVVDIGPKLDAGIELVAAAQCLPGESEHCIKIPFVTFKNSKEEAEASLELANATRPRGALIEVINKPTSLRDQYREQEINNPAGHRYCAENAYIGNEEKVADVLEEAFTTLPHPRAFSIYFAMTPCSRNKLADMAFSMQSDHYFATYACWEEAGDDERCSGWVRDVMSRIEKHSVGAYLGDSDFQVRRTQFWSQESGRKLMALRQKWDPGERFCGYLDVDDKSGLNGLQNMHEWKL
ncbi:hypothetical protein AC578_1999 [Pseudocercospora eumusae]|uniref:FAD-binding PCMH-type domain-containing protein n=1 Tax=Pseudocercospora eumusae TaxID=321146 RepID=A0A139HH73_9PEZI|nr:hypothetical protein AC578_1999 [Pseudocercospora eumusae]